MSRAQSYEPQVRLLNPAANPNIPDFPQFAELPVELREAIWEHSLCRERLLQVKLYASETVCPAVVPRGNGPQELPSQMDGYCIVLTEKFAISKLFRVNSESRRLAKQFYRVQLPCCYMWEDRVETQGIFYFNPDLDTLRVSPGIRYQDLEDERKLSGMRYFAQFAQDIWSGDRRHVGLVRLAISNYYQHDFRRFTWAFPPLRMISTSERPLFREVFSRLERVIFIYWNEDQRMPFDLRTRRNIPRQSRVGGHRSRPMLAAATTFDCLAQDPRPGVSEHLQRVMVGYKDPRHHFFNWLRLLALLQVQLRHKIDYRFMVTHGYRRGAAEPGNGPREKAGLVTDRDDALNFIREADAKWATFLQEEESPDKRRKRYAEKSEKHWRAHHLPRLKMTDILMLHREIQEPALKVVLEDLRMRIKNQVIASEKKERQGSLTPAIGFWLFPIEALGVLPEIRDEDLPLLQQENGFDVRQFADERGWDWKSFSSCIDLSAYQPELCLFHMP